MKQDVWSISFAPIIIHYPWLNPNCPNDLGHHQALFVCPPKPPKKDRFGQPQTDSDFARLLNAVVLSQQVRCCRRVGCVMLCLIGHIWTTPFYRVSGRLRENHLEMVGFTICSGGCSTNKSSWWTTKRGNCTPKSMWQETLLEVDSKWMGCIGSCVDAPVFFLRGDWST